MPKAGPSFVADLPDHPTKHQTHYNILAGYK
jgi:hypothetical protein